MAKCEVTQAQWVKVMGDNPSLVTGNDQLPVENVTWHDCQEFCRRLSQLTGRIVRLPSESEWEHACRAGTSTPWFFGSDADELGKYAWHNIAEPGLHMEALGVSPPHSFQLANSDGKPHPVGTKLPNPWGLHDLYGNVWEWCQDAGHYSEVYDDRHPRDGTPRVLVGIADERMTRGGCWATHYLGETYSAFHWSMPPEHKAGDLGLRVVVELDPQARPL